MTPAHLVQLAITCSILLLVFALGLRATPAEATYLVRRPAKLARAIVAMYVVVPAAATLLALAFEWRARPEGTRRSAGPTAELAESQAQRTDARTPPRGSLPGRRCDLRPPDPRS